MSRARFVHRAGRHFSLVAIRAPLAVAKTDNKGNTEWIEDGKTRDMSLFKTEKTVLSYPGGIALNGTEDQIYTTGNATQTTVESGVYTTTTSETIIAITKIKLK